MNDNAIGRIAIFDSITDITIGTADYLLPLIARALRTPRSVPCVLEGSLRRPWLPMPDAPPTRSCPAGATSPRARAFSHDYSCCN
eukprot:1362883-Pleurochrysis_carterae.AAC.2